MTKANRWAWIISLVAITGAVMVLSFLLSIATNNRAFYERHYVWLFWVNVAVAGFLVLVIGIAAVRLLVRVQRGKFGSRMLLKLAAIFALVGVIPGVLICAVSYQFVPRSIESWFDVKVEGALDAGLNLGRGTLDALVNDLANKTRLAAERLADRPSDQREVQPLALERLREQLSAQDIAIVGAGGQIIMSAGSTAGTLTLTLILAVFGALLLAVTLSNQLARPVLLLAQGVREVAQGDLSAKPVFASRDELGGLTRSFADMTEQLAEAREMVQKSVAQVESARSNLQPLLDTLTAGVVVFDRDGNIDTVNPGATRILRLPLSVYRGKRLEDVPGLEAFAAAVRHRFELHNTSPEAGERDQWQDSFDLQTASDRDTQTLLVRGAAMPQGARLMVFDDITEVVSAQRSAAWSEVARRLAHEIKNPLTPIQLSAERLQQRLEPKLEGTDQAMLVRAVGTIVSQVQAMKNLVNEFRDYARLPAARLKPLDLNALVREVLALYTQQQDAGRLHCELGHDLPPIMGDESQLRQVIHNLVQNALDAVADREDGRVTVRTEAARTDAGGVRAVRFTVTDNGPGLAHQGPKGAFEPYVTTKTKGTGLGLAVVKKIADEHAARVRIANLPATRTETPGAETTVGGAQVSLSFSKLAPPGSATPPPPPAAASSSPAERRAT